MRWLLDEMLPPATTAELTALGHEALSVVEAGLGGSDDAAVYETAVEQQRVVVTENFADFATITNDRLAAGAPCVPVVFVRKHQHPRGSALAPALARHLHEWSIANPNPYPGVHWP
ncbi:MAG: DUF5615 family PIN-like protein [Acidimicrobiaceae bacterium]|nr:DUF5615 family PIN-like protein [Acidimicrobiaceae bacterium]MDE0495028.1 DUF5615 family PIN-like protein [Acidimicrobiaceae bacterium]MDE0664146.1 DUF5615 family PIN-like protein [Acidimicrobiaceae bacterium]MYE65724.1 hypothetical protein [Acidimicrobiaceae bacterium]MYG79730.1 hypothetical protein [Acidimicrobiaceae bacterium]